MNESTIFATPTAGDPVLAEVLGRLVAAYRPECVYLFGSVARGDAGPDSDYDLLVVVPDDAPRNAGAAAWRMKFCGAPVPLPT